MVKVGDRVSSSLSYVFDDKAGSAGRPRNGDGMFHGVVTWIHPQRRFFVAEFKLRDGSTIRSCFREGEI